MVFPTHVVRRCQHDQRLISHHPAIVAGRDVDNITGVEVVGRSVVHDHPHPTGGDQHEMRKLTARRAGRWAEVLGPMPSWLKDGAAEAQLRELHRTTLAKVEGSQFVRLIEVRFRRPGIYPRIRPVSRASRDFAEPGEPTSCVFKSRPGLASE